MKKKVITLYLQISDILDCPAETSGDSIPPPLDLATDVIYSIQAPFLLYELGQLKPTDRA